DDGNDLNAGFAEQRVGCGVAVVGDHNAGFDGDQVVAAVPLLALGVIDIAASVDGLQLAQSEGGPNDLQERPGFFSDLKPWCGIARPEGEGVDAVNDARVDRDAVAIGEGEDRVQVHGRPQFRHAGDDHLLGRAFSEKFGGDLPDRLAGAAFAHPDDHHTVAGDEHVAAFQGGQAPVQLRVPPPDL